MTTQLVTGKMCLPSVPATVVKILLTYLLTQFRCVTQVDEHFAVSRMVVSVI